jgi:hypothetical protein
MINSARGTTAGSRPRFGVLEHRECAVRGRAREVLIGDTHVAAWSARACLVSPWR